MDGSFANQVLAQMYLYEKAFADIGGEIYVKVLPGKLGYHTTKTRYHITGNFFIKFFRQDFYINLTTYISKGFFIKSPSG
jgi:adenosylhomocysteinase